MHKFQDALPARAGFLSRREMDEVIRAADPDGAGGVLNAEKLGSFLSSVVGHSVSTADLTGLGSDVLTLDTLKMTVEDLHAKYPQWEVGGKLAQWLKVNTGASESTDALTADACQRLFKILDEDGSGELSVWELVRVMKVGGMFALVRAIMSGGLLDGKVTPEEFREMLQKMDADHPEMNVGERIWKFLGKLEAEGKPPDTGGAEDAAPDGPAPGDEPEVVAEDVGNKKALLVGINYVGQRAELGGCINDVRNEMEILKSQFGFAEENILLLTEDQDDDSKLPTTDNIREGFRWLFDGAAAGDLLFFAYSGHGSQMNDTSGTEADGKNECICPLDCQTAPWPEHLILDNEINDVFYKGLPDGVYCVCVFDCCHSATAADLQCTRELELDPDVASRYLPPPDEVQQALDDLRVNDGAAAREIAARGSEVEGKCLWVLSGCQDDQTSADATINGQRQGALTWSLLKALDSSNYMIKYNDLLTLVRKNLRGQYTQIPALSTTCEAHFNRHYLANAPAAA